MLYEIMAHIRNFFLTSERIDGKVNIVDGTIDLPFAEDGDYVLISGSRRNDGVYTAPLSGLKDEAFDGCVVLIAPPAAFISLCDEITAYVAKDGQAGPYTSESFGGYSYQKATNARGVAASWKDVFASRLNTWRKI